MNIIKVAFPEDQFYKVAQPKKQIVLHHTVSSTTNSPIDWWKQDPQHIGVAFVIGKDGVINQIWEPQYWAYHIGTGSRTIDNKQSIGIEIVNEGFLQLKDGIYYWNGRNTKLADQSKVLKLDSPWRGTQYYATYTDEQFNAVIELCAMLTKQFNIPRTVIDTYQYEQSLLSFPGIVSHHNLRADKSDVSKAFNLKLLGEKLAV